MSTVMRKAVEDDKNLVVKILVESFRDNPSVNYAVKQDRFREKRIAALLEYSFELCLTFGEIWINNTQTGCALVIYPRQKRTTFRTIYLDLRLILTAIGIRNLPAVLRREAKIKSHHPNEDIAHLWFIGVRPESQHQGIGSELLKKVITRATTINRPVFLETSIPQNVTWYERFGFKVFEKIHLPYTLYLIKKS